MGWQVCLDAIDSSNSVIDGDERLHFCVGCKASMAFVAAFRFSRVGGSAITIDVFGKSNGGANSVTVSVGGCGGAGMIVFFGFVGMRTRSVLDTLEWIDATALMSLAFFLCLIFLFPSNFVLAFFACCLMRSSVILTVCNLGLRSA